MTTPMKTQCPHCQACFKVQQTQLNKVNATVNCDQCQQSFLVNQHLIVTADDPNHTADPADTSTHQYSQPDTKIDATAPSKKTSKDIPSDTLIHDDLIYDDMDIDEPEEDILEYDSLESMDEWLTQASAASTKTKQASPKQSSGLDKSTSSSTEASSAQVALSSAAANDIRANIDDSADNLWLEKLLKEQNIDEKNLEDDTDLSKLLTDMGVPLKRENNPAKDQDKKDQTRYTPTAQKRSIASLLWILGCLVLALLLFAQYIIFNLETLVKNPVHAERLQAVCAIAACSLPSADLSALTTTNASHRASQIKQGGQFSDISATLNNQSAQAQLYPDISVHIYGADDELIGAFIAAPADYLLSKQNQLAANSARQLLFTIPVTNRQIKNITIEPIY